MTDTDQDRQCNTKHAITSDTIEYHWIPYDTIKYNVISSNTKQYQAIPLSTIKYHAIPFTTIQYHLNSVFSPRCYIHLRWRFFYYKYIIIHDIYDIFILSEKILKYIIYMIYLIFLTKTELIKLNIYCIGSKYLLPKMRSAHWQKDQWRLLRHKSKTNII